MNYEISYESNPKPEDIQLLNDAITAIAKQKKGMKALDFYKKLGYYVEFARKGFDKNSIFYFLRKDLR